MTGFVKRLHTVSVFSCGKCSMMQHCKKVRNSYRIRRKHPPCGNIAYHVEHVETNLHAQYVMNGICTTINGFFPWRSPCNERVTRPKDFASMQGLACCMARLQKMRTILSILASRMSKAPLSPEFRSNRSYKLDTYMWSVHIVVFVCE